VEISTCTFCFLEIFINSSPYPEYDMTGLIPSMFQVLKCWIASSVYMQIKIYKCLHRNDHSEKKNTSLEKNSTFYTSSPFFKVWLQWLVGLSIELRWWQIYKDIVIEASSLQLPKWFSSEVFISFFLTHFYLSYCSWWRFFFYPHMMNF
jgi:hypothetical protein